jgi:hypothetical protein
MGYISRQDSQMRPSPASLRCMSPLHLGHANISNKSLLIVIFFTPLSYFFYPLPTARCSQRKACTHQDGRPMAGRMTTESYFAIRSLRSAVRGLCSLPFACCLLPPDPIPRLLGTNLGGCIERLLENPFPPTRLMEHRSKGTTVYPLLFAISDAR